MVLVSSRSPWVSLPGLKGHESHRQRHKVNCWLINHRRPSQALRLLLGCSCSGCACTFSFIRVMLRPGRWAETTGPGSWDNTHTHTRQRTFLVEPQWLADISGCGNPSRALIRASTKAKWAQVQESSSNLKEKHQEPSRAIPVHSICGWYWRGASGNPGKPPQGERKTPAGPITHPWLAACLEEHCVPFIINLARLRLLPPAWPCPPVT